jgi:hypothetical protein
VASAVASSLSSHVSVSFSLELLPLTSALAPALSCSSAIAGPPHVREPQNLVQVRAVKCDLDPGSCYFDFGRCYWILESDVSDPGKCYLDLGKC